MKLFSNSRKNPTSLYGPATDSPSSAHSNDGNSSPHPGTGLAGFGVVDSFKKLRSSVLQGIQSKGAASHNGDHVPLPEEAMANGSAVKSSDPGLANMGVHFKTTGGYNVPNGSLTVQMLAGISQYGSDIEDCDDEETDVDGLTRNSRFSRSIRRAYGAGRICLLDMVNGRQAGSTPNEAAITTQKPETESQTSKVNVQTENPTENANTKVLSRLSKSAENLHIFKTPFRRKTPSPSIQEDLQRNSSSNGTPSIQRTSSASSVDLRDRADSCRRAPLKTKGPMLKLVGSMTDLTVRRRRSPSPSPTSPSPMSPLSRLHDDYSRRIPCQQSSERQRRPLTASAQVASVEHAPVIHHQPESYTNPELHQVIIDPLSFEPSQPTKQILSSMSAQYEPLTDATTRNDNQMVEYFSSKLSQRDTLQHPGQNESSSLPNEVRHKHKPI